MVVLGTIKEKWKQRYFPCFGRCLLAFCAFFGGQSLQARDAGETPLAVKDDEFEKRRDQEGVFEFNRWDHNFALSFGMAKGSWTIEQMGPVQGLDFDSRAYFSKFQYSFHLPLHKNLGYVLGSSFGYYWEKRLDNAQFHRVSAIHFPGIHLGLVYNFTSYFRILGGVETYLERLDDITVTTTNSTTHQQEKRSVSLTMRPNFDWILASDIFYHGSWGLRVEWHNRRVISTPPSKSEGEVVGARLVKRDTWIGLGLIFHLFAT